MRSCIIWEQYQITKHRQVKALYPEQDQLNVLNNKLDKNTPTKCKKRRFSIEKRKQIYSKTKGHCYLCGDFVDFDTFEIEHRIPRSKGGTNDLKNLYCACHICNLIKHDIYPQDFDERISKIYLYQMGKSIKINYYGKFCIGCLLRWHRIIQWKKFDFMVYYI